jgi:hypothetical protein
MYSVIGRFRKNVYNNINSTVAKYFGINLSYNFITSLFRYICNIKILIITLSVVALKARDNCKSSLLFICYTYSGKMRSIIHLCFTRALWLVCYWFCLMPVTVWAITYHVSALILLSNYRYIVLHIMSYESLPPFPPPYINWLILPVENLLYHISSEFWFHKTQLKNNGCNLNPFVKYKTTNTRLLLLQRLLTMAITNIDCQRFAEFIIPKTASKLTFLLKL